jgi:glycolate oxidase iron-sulfur subunit
MRTGFSATQLADPHIADAERSLRACMHCGICTATCPTYVLLGDERDGPRGRIVMMQKMLEDGGAPSAETVLHVDRCLSCLACRTACPSSVDYARLVDVARAHIETHYRRTLGDRLLRWFIAHALTRPNHIRFGLALARFFSPVAGALPGRLGAIARLGAALPRPEPNRLSAQPPRQPRRIALLPGCVQGVVAPEIDEALIRVLARRGLAASPLKGSGCCGAVAHHLGKTAEAKAWARRIIESFERASGDFEAVAISATGCGAHLKELPHLFRGDAVWEPRARALAEKLRDVSELASPKESWPPRRLKVAFHVACSAQNGLRLEGKPQELLRKAGFDVLEIPEGHLCCGSAGSYSLLQPEISGELRARKLRNIASIAPDVVATGNIGCLIHLSGAAQAVVHYIELLDWVEGGAKPRALRRAQLELSRANN